MCMQKPEDLKVWHSHIPYSIVISEKLDFVFEQTDYEIIITYPTPSKVHSYADIKPQSQSRPVCIEILATSNARQTQYPGFKTKYEHF